MFRPYTKTQARSLINALLKDEHGVSEEAYSEIRQLISSFGLEDEFKHVDATDGRFYLGED